MITAKELAEWAASLPPETELAIDDGGLSIVEIGNEDECYNEIGGVPLCECGREASECATFDGEAEHGDR